MWCIALINFQILNHSYIPGISSVKSAACQASLSITNSWHLHKLMSIKSVIPSNHLILCHPLLLLPSIFPSIGWDSFQMSQFFTTGGQSIGVSASASVLPMNIQDWFPLGGTGWISLQSKGLSRVFSNTIVQRHQFFDTQLSLSGEGNGNPLQYSCLENFTDWGAGRLQSMGSQRVGPDWVTPLTWALFIVQLSHDYWKNHSFD